MVRHFYASNLILPFNKINVDWFQPFKHVTDSVGVMYLSILNLPRSEPYKSENIILCGIIPGPVEPKNTINSYLYPLVQELLELWEGITMNTATCGQSIIRAALFCLASDIPATRKVIGFAGHSASMGCSKCMKKFTYLHPHNKLDYSGFNCTHWKQRTLEDYKLHSAEFLSANTKSKQSEVIKKYGVRHIVLLQLPYFNIVRFHVIDTMHNSLLGMAKHVTRVWCETGVLSTNDLQKIQETVSLITVPIDVGRIPSKIASSYSGFTVDQWRNWTCIYSPIALKNVIPSPHLRC